MKKLLRNLLLLTLFILFSALTAYGAEKITIEAKTYSTGSPSKVNSASLTMAKNTSVGFSVDFENSPSEILFEAANDSQHSGPVEIRLDSSGGKIIGTVNTARHANWQRASYSVPVTEDISGKHTIWFVFKGISHDFYTLSFMIPDPSEKYETFSEKDNFIDISGSPMRSQINLLSDLGILEKTGDTFDGERLITKREFIRALGGFYSEPPKTAYDGQLFNDITVSDKDYNLIMWLCSTGVLKANPSVNLSLDGEMKYSEACDILVRMLGFDEEAYYRGSSFEVARRIGLLTGVKMSSSGRLKRYDMVSLLWNAVDGEYNKMSGIAGGYLRYVTDANVLEYTNGLYMTKGVVGVTQNNNLYSNDNTAPSGTVIIDDEKYYCSNTPAAKYFGMNCIAFYKIQNNMRILVAIRPDIDTEYVYLSSKETDFANLSDNVISYYEDNKTEDLILSSNAIIMYNGKKADDSLAVLTGNGDFTGTVLAIDNDSDRKYDTVIVEQATTIIFGGVTQTAIYDLLKNQNINYQDTSKIRLIYGSNGGLWDSLKLGTVLDVFESKNKKGEKLIRMYPVNSTVIGVVSEIDGENTITMEDGSVYEAYDYVKKPIVLGKAITIKLNSFGEYIDYTIGTPSAVALMLNKDYIGSGLSRTYAVRLLTEDNEIHEYEFADSVYADGVICKTADEICGGKDDFVGLGNVQDTTIVLYSLNGDGEIAMIDTVEAGNGGNYDVVKVTASNGRYQIRGSYLSETTAGDIRDQNAVLKTGYKILGVSTTGNEEEHGFMNKPGGNEDAQYNLTGYGISSSDSFITDIIVISRGNSTSKGKHFIVTKRYYRLGGDGEKELVIDGIAASGNVSYVMDDYAYDNSETLRNIADSVMPGDMLQVCTNFKNKITDIVINYLHNGAASNSSGINASLTPSNGYVSYDWSRGKIYCGEIIGSEEGFVKIKTTKSDGTEVINYLNTNGIKLLQCETTDGKYLISATGSAWLSVGQKVIVCLDPYGTEPNLAVIYK